MTLSVNGKIHAHLTTELNHATNHGTADRLAVKADHYRMPAGALNEEDVEYVFCGTGFSTTKDLYTARRNATAEHPEQDLHTFFHEENARRAGGAREDKAR